MKLEEALLQEYQQEWSGPSELTEEERQRLIDALKNLPCGFVSVDPGPEDDRASRPTSRVRQALVDSA